MKNSDKETPDQSPFLDINSAVRDAPEEFQQAFRNFISLQGWNFDFKRSFELEQEMWRVAPERGLYLIDEYLVFVVASQDGWINTVYYYSKEETNISWERNDERFDVLDYRLKSLKSRIRKQKRWVAKDHPYFSFLTSIMDVEGVNLIYCNYNEARIEYFDWPIRIGFSSNETKIMVDFAGSSFRILGDATAPFKKFLDTTASLKEVIKSIEG